MASIKLFDTIRLGTEIRRTDRHVLAGTTVVNGAPASKLVAVFQRSTLQFVAAKWSNPTTGAWRMEGLPQYNLKDLFVVHFDETGQFNAIVYDFITQEVRA